jgi:hypothetical protein
VIVTSGTADKRSDMPPHQPHEPHEHHCVYMSFFLLEGWQVQFLDPDLKTSLPLKLTLADPETIRELARQGSARGTSDAMRMLEHAIHMGRGGVHLRLNDAQYRTLRQSGCPEQFPAYLDLVRKHHRRVWDRS